MATITANVTTANWNTNGAWVGSVQPTAADDVIIPSGAVISIPVATNVFARSVTVQAGGTVTQNVASATLNIGDGTAGAGNVALSVSASATWNISGAQGTIVFVSTSATQQTINTGGKTMTNMTFNGAGASFILGAALTSSGTITLNAGTFNTANYSLTYATLSTGSGTTRTLTLGSSTLTASSTGMTYGNLSNLTITPNTAICTVTATPTSFNNVFVLNSFNWQGTSFVLTGGGSGSLNIANATIGDLTINSTANQTNAYRVSGNFTCNSFNVTGNSDLNRPLIFAVNNGTPVTITAASTSLTNVDFMDITGAGAASWGITGGVIGDCLGNSGITFTTPATQTRDATNGQAWSVAARWTSRVPLPQDNVVINGSSGSISATDVLKMGKSIDFTGYTGTLTHTSAGGNYNIYGDLIYSSGMTFGAGVNTFNFDFRGRGTHVITSAGKTFFPFSSNQTITIAAPGGSYTLTDGFSQSAGLSVGNYTLTVTAGTFDSASQTMNVGKLTNSGTIARTVTLGTSTINLMATAATALISHVATGLTFSGASAVFNVVNASANTRSIDLAGVAIGTFTYTNAGSTGQLTVSSSGTINTLNFSDANNARSLVLISATILTCANFNVFGTAGKLMTVKSATTAVAYLNELHGGTLYDSAQDYIAYEYIQVIQPLSLWLNTNSTATNSVGIYASAPTYRPKQSVAAAQAVGLSTSATYPLATTAGNLLIAYFTSSNTQGTYTPPTGWTLAKLSSNNVLVYIYYKIADGTESTVAFSQTTSRTLNVTIAEYLGFSGIPTLDVTDGNISGGASTSLSTTATTGPTNTAQPALALAMVANASTLNATISLSNSFIEDRTLQNASSVYKGGVKELTTLAAVETTFTWTTSRSSSAAALAVFINVDAGRKIKLKQGGVFAEYDHKVKVGGVFI